MNLNYADGHGKAMNRRGTLRLTAFDVSSPTVPIRVYNFPYDCNGVPDVIAESH